VGANVRRDSLAKAKELNLFVQNVGQGQAEGIEDIPAQMIGVLEWRPRGH